MRDALTRIRQDLGHLRDELERLDCDPAAFHAAFDRPEAARGALVQLSCDLDDAVRLLGAVIDRSPPDFLGPVPAAPAIGASA